jgi:hypothetical protein
MIWKIPTHENSSPIFCNESARELLNLPRDENIQSSDFLFAISETQFVKLG